MTTESPRPRVSAVIPVCNGQRYLAEAIDSVLGQKRIELELIVVDDGSTDGSAAIAKSYGSVLQYHYQPNAGLGAARNKGVALARGEWVAFLDCDDLWVAEKSAWQLEAFVSDPRLDMVFGHVEQFVSPELVGRDDAPGLPPNAMMPGYSASALFARRAVFDRVGPFSSEFRLGEFLDWHGRATDAGIRTSMLAETVVYRRIHMDNMGVRERDKRNDYLRVFKTALDRRRRKADSDDR